MPDLNGVNEAAVVKGRQIRLLTLKLERAMLHATLRSSEHRERYPHVDCRTSKSVSVQEPDKMSAKS